MAHYLCKGGQVEVTKDGVAEMVPNTKALSVYLDDKLLKTAFECDTDAGWVKYYKTDSYGKFSLLPLQPDTSVAQDRIQRLEAHGKVEVRERT
jgi:hypothetical protein